MPSHHPVRHRTWAALLAAASLALTACSADDGGSARSAADGKAAAPTAGTDRQGAAADSAASGTSGASDAKSTTPQLPANIIRTASLSVRVPDVDKALASARTTTTDAGGYVGEETTTRDADDIPHTEVVLRVPVERYDAVLDALQGTGTLLERTAKAEDVTDQVVDVDSRVRSQRASVARVRALMDRAGDLSDIVSLESELSRREADLEALLSRQASLKDRTSLATITLALTGEPAHREKPKRDDAPGFLDALSGGWGVFVSILRWFVIALAAAAPFLLTAALAAFVWLRLVRTRARKREEQP